MSLSPVRLARPLITTLGLAFGLVITTAARAQEPAPPPAAPAPEAAPPPPAAPAPEAVPPATTPEPAAEAAPPAAVPAEPPAGSAAPAAIPPAPSPPVEAAAKAEPAAAPEFLPLRAAGSIWSRYELRSGFQEHGLSHPRLHREGDYIVSRARLSLATNPVDVGEGVMVSGTFVPQASYTFGENTGATPTVSDHPAIGLYEGYASVGSKSYRFDAGRFAMNYGDALVIGNLDWNESARAFNGARLHLTPSEEPYFIDVFGTLITEGRLQSQKPFSGDSYFYGIYAGLGPLVAKDTDLDVYVLGHSTAGNNAFPVIDPADPTAIAEGDLDATTEITVGSRVKGKVSMLDYRAEAGLQFGRRPIIPTFAARAPKPRSKFAYQVDAEVGLSPVKSARIGLEGLIASGDDSSTTGDDEGYNELYPTGHKFLGLADITGPRTNMVSAVLHLKYAPVTPLTFLVDAHYFSRPEAGADGKDGAMGEEIDTNVLYAIGKGASVRGMYAIFVPNQDFWEPKSTSPGVAGDPLHYFELQFGYDFK